jgi:hypothetical protein
MLDGVRDTSEAMLLFGVRPFAEEIPAEKLILQDSRTDQARPSAPGAALTVHRSIMKRGRGWSSYQTPQIFDFATEVESVESLVTNGS